MRTLLGILLIIAGFALGAYVGIWVCFVGGIVDIIETAKAGVWDASEIAWGVAKILFAGGAGSISAWLLLIPGFAMVNGR